MTSRIKVKAMTFQLKVNRKYPWSMMASVYATQYLGLAFIMSAAITILRQQGVSLDKLALLNLAVLPLLGKLFYAPVIDKFRPFLQGKYRSWLIVAQSFMACFLLVAGLLDIEHQFNTILIVMMLYVFSVSIQDVAIDGLSCKLFDSEARKMASSIQFSGNLFGNIVGGGLVLMLYPWLEWQGSLWLLAGFTTISLIQIICFFEPQNTTQSSTLQESTTPLFRDIKKFVVQHKRWFFILALYPIGSTCGFSLLNPLLVDNGWALDEIGFAMKVYGSLVGLVFALLATPFMSRLGRQRALLFALFIQAVALLLILPITFGLTGKLIVYLAISVHFISFPFLLVISSTMMMDNAAQTIHKATFFTLQFSVASFLGFLYSSMSMLLAKHIGYSNVVLAGLILTCLILLTIAWLLNRRQAEKPLNAHLTVTTE